MSETRTRPKRAEVRLPDIDTVYTINPDGSRNFLHPADVKGRFQVRKNLVFAVLIAIYIVLPWIKIGGHPAVQLDIPGRNAFLFGLTFTNQDFYLMFFVLSGIGFTLFVITSLWGRIWCGYACPQTVFLEGVYRKIERRIEGPRAKRIRRNLGPATFDKIWRKTLKHGIFLGLSVLLAHAFVAYFIPVHELGHAVFRNPAAHKTAFLWTMAWTAILYFDYSWFREQTCLIICPYGRLQSALIDRDSIIIGYDGNRGEPRSKVNDDGGDCIDCKRCVQVCPTGIDIRNGLQLECVGCANCVDACDEIMGKIHRPPGLIRYDSLNGFEGKPRARLLRPRVFVYAFLGLLGLTVATGSVVLRKPFEVKALRARGLPYTLEEGRVRDLYTIHIQNKQREARTYRIELPQDPARPFLKFIAPQTRLTLDALADAEVPIFAYLAREQYEAPFPLTFTVVDSASGHRRSVKVRFRGP